MRIENSTYMQSNWVNIVIGTIRLSTQKSNWKGNHVFSCLLFSSDFLIKRVWQPCKYNQGFGCQTELFSLCIIISNKGSVQAKLDLQSSNYKNTMPLVDFQDYKVREEAAWKRGEWYNSLSRYL